MYHLTEWSLFEQLIWICFLYYFKCIVITFTLLFNSDSDMSSSSKMYVPVVLPYWGYFSYFQVLYCIYIYICQNGLKSFDWFRYSIFLWNINVDSLIRFWINIFCSLRCFKFAGVCLCFVNWPFLAVFPTLFVFTPPTFAFLFWCYCNPKEHCSRIHNNVSGHIYLYIYYFIRLSFREKGYIGWQFIV